MSLTLPVSIYLYFAVLVNPHNIRDLLHMGWGGGGGGLTILLLSIFLSVSINCDFGYILA